MEKTTKKQIKNNDILNIIDKKFTEMWNKRDIIIRDPDMCKLIEINGKFYYPGEQIDALDDELWEQWRKFIEEQK